jgi:methyl-accepting chemotaxis protein
MLSLKNTPVRMKLNLLIISSFLAIMAVSTLMLLNLRENLLKDRYDHVQTVVESAISMAGGFLDMEQSGAISHHEAQAEVIKMMQNLRYDGENYVWINDMQPAMIMHPFKPELNGKSLAGSKDPQGTPLFVNMVNVVAEKGEGFVPYKWPKPGQTLPVDKISYVKAIPEWGWIVGTGVYIDDVNAVFIQEAIRVGSICIFIFIALMVLSSVVSRSIRQPLTRIEHGMQALGDGDEIHVTDTDRRDEIGRMASSLERLQVKLQEAKERRRSHRVATQPDGGNGR